MQENLHLQYYNHRSLLLVNPKGQLRIIYVPFRVLCIAPTDHIPQNTWVFVEEILSSRVDQLYFVVFGQPYLYKSFRLAINF